MELPTFHKAQHTRSAKEQMEQLTPVNPLPPQ